MEETLILGCIWKFFSSLVKSNKLFQVDDILCFKSWKKLGRDLEENEDNPDRTETNLGEP